MGNGPPDTAPSEISCPKLKLDKSQPGTFCFLCGSEKCLPQEKTEWFKRQLFPAFLELAPAGQDGPKTSRQGTLGAVQRGPSPGICEAVLNTDHVHLRQDRMHHLGDVSLSIQASG